MANASTPRPHGLNTPIAVRELAVVADANISSVSAAPSLTVGAGAPSATKAQGSLYLRTDGAADSTLYLNTDGATTWVAVSTVP